MKILWFDSETYSEKNLKQGTYQYTEDAEIMIVTYAFDDDKVKTWDRTLNVKMPDDLARGLDECHSLVREIWAQNSMFDRTVGIYNFGNIMPPITRWRDTMIQAYMCGIPGALAKMSEVLQLPVDLAKDKAGGALIRLFCMPQADGSRATRITHPKQWKAFLKYADKDIVSMRECHTRMPLWNFNMNWMQHEWHLDQVINDRGFFVDTELALSAIDAVKVEQKKLRAKTAATTGGQVASTTQVDVLLEHILREYGVSLPNMQKATLKRRMEDPDIPQGIKDLIAIRLQQSATSTRKYTSVMNALSKDGRCRGTIQFGGAQRTLRAAGRVFQPHNLPSRGLLLKDEVDFGIDALKTGLAPLFYENVMHLCTSAVRGIVCAAPDKKLLVSDLSNIEGRSAAWVADEDWKLQAFCDYDAGTGPDLYKLAYAKSFRFPIDDIDTPKRDIGKVMELMLGYGGGVGAYVTGAATYNFDIEDMAADAWDSLPENTKHQSRIFYEWSIEKNMPGFGLSEKAYITCDVFKRLWRESNPAIVSFWYELQDAIVKSIGHPAVTVRAKKLLVRTDGAWLRIRLPSGRYLCYADPQVNEEGDVSYMGIHQYTKKWERLKAWHGKFFENVCQGIARDVLYVGITGLEKANYPVVLHVHDEAVCEVPDTKDYTLEKVNEIMATNVDWNEGLPLKAAGFETYRYRK